MTTDCLLGEWTVADLGAFIEASFKGMLGVRRLTYQRAEGDVRFDFAPDGTLTIRATQYVVTVTAKVRIVGDVETAVVFDGVVTGRYALSGDQLAFTGTDRSGFSVKARLPFGTFDAGDQGLFGDGVNRVACGPGELLLWPGAEDTPPIRLVRPAPPVTPAA